jgi:hypothetical protein
MSNRRRSTQKRKTGSQGILHLKSASAREIRAMNSMIENGPVTIMLVFSKTCPHCVTYMPIWKKLCKTQGRKANMISMEASTYQNTELAQKKSVSGVPTVLYVNQKGEITEAPTPRDTTAMTNAVRITPESDLPASVVMSANVRRTSSESKPMKLSSSPVVTESNRLTSKAMTIASESQPIRSLTPAPLPPKAMTIASESQPIRSLTPAPLPPTSEPKPLTNAVIPGTMTSENPLAPLPAMPVQGGGFTQTGGKLTQTGGSPWAAFLMAARQAAPAAALLGAYAALPAKRSSGLSAPRRTRRRRH